MRYFSLNFLYSHKFILRVFVGFILVLFLLFKNFVSVLTTFNIIVTFLFVLDTCCNFSGAWGVILDRCRKIKSLKQYVCPNLNGVWKGTIKSNFEGSEILNIEVEIKNSISFIDMTISTERGSSYITSSSLYVNQSNQFVLKYFYEVQNRPDFSTDTNFYDGAAKLVLYIGKDEELRLEGVYWTDRCFEQNKNTAGIIKIKKLKN